MGDLDDSMHSIASELHSDPDSNSDSDNEITRTPWMTLSDGGSPPGVTQRILFSKYVTYNVVLINFVSSFQRKMYVMVFLLESSTMVFVTGY